jgi:LysR family transcriptional regulator, cyn operon transcriptional activator
MLEIAVPVAPGPARASCPTMHSAPCPTSNCCLSTGVTGSRSRSTPPGSGHIREPSFYVGLTHGVVSHSRPPPSRCERARALKSGQTGVLRVGATPQLIESMMVAFLAEYQQRHPGVEVRLTEDGGIRLPMRMERGDVHLATIPEGDERFASRLLYPIYVLAVMAAHHRLRRRAVLDVVELVGEPLLLLTRAFASREWLYSACQAARIRPNIAFESAAPQTLIALAAGGHGIAVVPQGVLIPRAKVHAVPLVHRGVPIGRWQTVAWDSQRFLAPYAHQFIAELVAYSRRNYPNCHLTGRAPLMPRPKEPTS